MNSAIFSLIYSGILLFLSTACVVASSIPDAPSRPETYQQAKIELRDHVYHDRSNTDFGSLYCGCSWDWTTRSGGSTDLEKSCDYESEGNEYRASRIEYEHIVPASIMGSERECWKDGGRMHCATEDPVFGAMYTDMHNLTPTIGEVNAQRSNYPYGLVEGNDSDYGGCETKFDEHRKVLEPRDEAKGFVARVIFYMVDHYDLRDEVLTPRLEKTLIQWDQAHPVTEWEQERNLRIARIQGNSNPFVTREKRWNKDYQPSGTGIESISGDYQSTASDPDSKSDKSIIGNRQGDIYHLPEGCPSYSRVTEKNRIEFKSVKVAEEAGYRLAGNCRYRSRRIILN